MTDGHFVPILAFAMRAQNGERNTSLFWAACRLAEHVRDGQLAETDMMDWVIGVGERIGLDHKEARNSALSALRIIR